MLYEIELRSNTVSGVSRSGAFLHRFIHIMPFVMQLFTVNSLLDGVLSTFGEQLNGSRCSTMPLVKTFRTDWARTRIGGMGLKRLAGHHVCGRAVAVVRDAVRRRQGRAGPRDVGRIVAGIDVGAKGWLVALAVAVPC